MERAYDQRRARSSAQLLARLRAVGLAQYQVRRLGPLLGPRPIRLWSLTSAAALERLVAVIPDRVAQQPLAAGCLQAPVEALAGSHVSVQAG